MSSLLTETAALLMASRTPGGMITAVQEREVLLAVLGLSASSLFAVVVCVAAQLLLLLLLLLLPLLLLLRPVVATVWCVLPTRPAGGVCWLHPQSPLPSDSSSACTAASSVVSSAGTLPPEHLRSRFSRVANSARLGTTPAARRREVEGTPRRWMPAASYRGKHASLCRSIRRQRRQHITLKLD
jgi:hypothetical protein